MSSLPNSRKKATTSEKKATKQSASISFAQSRLDGTALKAWQTQKLFKHYQVQSVIILGKLIIGCFDDKHQVFFNEKIEPIVPTRLNQHSLIRLVEEHSPDVRPTLKSLSKAAARAGLTMCKLGAAS